MDLICSNVDVIEKMIHWCDLVGNSREEDNLIEKETFESYIHSANRPRGT